MDKNNCDKPQFSGERVRRLGELISKAKVARCGSADYPVLSMTMHDGIVEQSGRFKKAIASTDKSTYKVVNPGQLVIGFPIDEGVLYVQNCGYSGIVPFPVSWTVKMKKKQKETQDILSYHTQAAGCSDKARAKASGGRQPIEECGRTGL